MFFGMKLTTDVPLLFLSAVDNNSIFPYFYVTSMDFKKKKLWPLFMDWAQLPQGWRHFEEAVYFLPLSSQKFTVLILSTSEE